MAEYLDRAVILSMPEPLKSNRHYQTYNLDDAYEQGWSDALRRIEYIPSADVFPVMHGRWERRFCHPMRDGEWQSFWQHKKRGYRLTVPKISKRNDYAGACVVYFYNLKFSGIYSILYIESKKGK